jgi:addiction module HigA family antidote
MAPHFGNQEVDSEKHCRSDRHCRLPLNTMKIRKPAEVFPPGDYIREELEARGWTQGELAEIIGRSQPAVNEMITGKRGITAETALALSAAFGTSPEFWMNLQMAYALAHAETDVQAIQRRARTFGLPRASKSRGELVRR